MNSSTSSLEEMYARLAMEEEEEGIDTGGDDEQQSMRPTYILVKSVNFNAMRNVMASLWGAKGGDGNLRFRWI